MTDTTAANERAPHQSQNTAISVPAGYSGWKEILSHDMQAGQEHRYSLDDLMDFKKGKGKGSLQVICTSPGQRGEVFSPYFFLVVKNYDHHLSKTRQ